jgi:tetratricopeptide (TPR) repeat protein
MPTIEQLEELLAGDANDPFLHYALAMELVKAGRPDEALERFDRALSVDDQYTAAYHHKGNTLIGMGDHDQAAEVLRKGIEIARSSGDDHAAGEMADLLAEIPIP